MIHVFIGTKAQYIKMAPLLRRMDDERVDYRLIDSGQHAALAERYRSEFGLRDPDLRMGGDDDVESIPEAVRWALGLSVRLVSRTKLRDEVFGGHDGVYPSLAGVSRLGRSGGARWWGVSTTSAVSGVCGRRLGVR